MTVFVGSALGGALAKGPSSPVHRLPLQRGGVSVPRGEMGSPLPGRPNYNPNQVFAGGNPNFDERTGQYKPSMSPPLTQAPPLQRLSPGVYRNSQGQLVGSQGQQLPGAAGRMAQHPPQQQPYPGSVLGGLVGGAGATGGFGNKPYYFPPGQQMYPGAFQMLPQQLMDSALRGAQQGAQQGDFNPYSPSAITQASQAAQQGGFNPNQMQRQKFDPNNPPQPGMQVQYGMTGQPIGWGWGETQS